MLHLIKGRYKIARFCGYTVLMKLFKSTNTDTIDNCRIHFNFLMRSEQVEIRKNRFEGKLIDCCNL